MKQFLRLPLALAVASAFQAPRLHGPRLHSVRLQDAGGRFFERVREQMDQPPEAVVRAVESAGGRVTAADVSRLAGVDLREAQRGLSALCTLTGGALEVSEADGDVVYCLPANAGAELRRQSSVAQLRETYNKYVYPVLFYLLRVGFGLALVASIALVYSAIFAIGSSGSDRDDRDDRRQQGGFGFGPSLYWGPSPFDWFFYRPYYGFYGSPSYAYRYVPNGQPVEVEMGFFDALFSYIFGDGDINSGIEREQLRLCARAIRANDGVVAAEQLAPFLAGGSGLGSSSEDYMLPVLTALRGEPVVSEEGDILYRFPELAASSAETYEAEKSLLTPSQRGMLLEASSGELLALAGQLGVDARGATEKEALRSAVRSALEARAEARGAQRGGWPFGGGAEDRGAAADVLLESEKRFSAASGFQKALSGGLCAVNLAGALYLAGQLAAIPAGYALTGVAGLAAALLPFLLPYAIALNAIPLVRFLRIKADNQDINDRNDGRRLAAARLASPDPELQRKVGAAKAEARRMERLGDGNRVIGQKEVGYSSSKSLAEQVDPFLDFDRRLRGEAN